MSEIVIIDYGMGNLRSVYNKIQRSGFKVVISDEESVLRTSSKIILPGVGHFQNGMKNLRKKGLIEILNTKVIEEKTPILGICLGMQLLTKYSEEGNIMGLGWLDAETVKFRLKNIQYKVPHIGWNSLEKKRESVLLAGIPVNSFYYFVHSYHVKCNDNEDILTTTDYGYSFVSSVQKENIFGTQFHPEKSHEWGEKILKNFLNL
jgi:glutamine amidotransferase